MFCTNCGVNAGSARFCPSCGTPTATEQPYPNTTVPAGQPGLRRQVWVPIVIGIVTIGVLVVLLGILLLRGANDPSDPTAATAPSASATSAASKPSTSPEASPTPKARPRRTKTITVTPTPTPTSAPAPGDVRVLPAGLFCRDLNAQGYSYVAAIDYWRMHGQPDQMDADRNGIPCETVYPASDVTAYWGGRSLPTLESTGGLFCRDLYLRGFNYPEAVAYWWLEGMPNRMDEDLNGIPCETVYPASDVLDFWYR